MSMTYGYARVSTTHQSNDGNSIEAQTAELREKGAAVVVAESYTGTTTNRPKFAALLAKLQPGDTLMVTKLDRFARTVREGIEVIDDLLARGVTIHILNMGILDSTPVGRLTRTMFLAFAEFERDMIIQRTTEGKRVARQNNPDYREGRRPAEYDRSLFWTLSDQIGRGLVTVTEAARQLGVSRRTWYNIVAREAAARGTTSPPARLPRQHSNPIEGHRAP